jgi:hypothetical protein
VFRRLVLLAHDPLAQCKTTTNAPSQCHSADTSSNAQLTTAQSPLQRKGKRGFGEDSADGGGGDRNDEDDDRRRSKRAKQRGCDVDRQKFLACPFYKKDPNNYIECFTKKLDTVSHMKEHLRRRHLPPEFYCQRCKVTFKSKAILDTHIDPVTCVFLKQNIDGITRDQEEQLRRRGRGSEEEQWFAVWSVLFPTSRRPSSIYRHVSQQEVVDRLQEFALSSGVAIMRDVLRNSGRELWDVSDGRLEEVVRTGLSRIFIQFHLDPLLIYPPGTDSGIGMLSLSSPGDLWLDTGTPFAPSSFHSLENQPSADPGPATSFDPSVFYSLESPPGAG